jgi:hypothetical protein
VGEVWTALGEDGDADGEEGYCQGGVGDAQEGGVAVLAGVGDEAVEELEGY